LDKCPKPPTGIERRGLRREQFGAGLGFHQTKGSLRRSHGAVIQVYTRAKSVDLDVLLQTRENSGWFEGVNGSFRSNGLGHGQGMDADVCADVERRHARLEKMTED